MAVNQTRATENPGCVVRIENAFNPVSGRVVELVHNPISIREWLDAKGIAEFTRPTICLMNGVAVLRAAWRVMVIRPGDICCFVALPSGGGGGGGGGKSPLKTVLTIAVMVGAAYFAPGLGAGISESLFGAGHFASGLTATQLAIGKGIAGALITTVGTALVNAVVPPPKPTASGFLGGGFSAPPAASPTYSLQGQGNAARLGQAISCQYGRHKIFPDLIMSEPWVFYSGNEQYVCQPHCLGLGVFDVEKILIADSDISSFEEIDYEIVEPGDDVSLFDINVITRPEVSGQELRGSNEWVDDGFVGPFVVNPVDTIANKIGVDIIFARGLYYANDSGGLDNKTATWVVQVRPIDDDDLPTGDESWTTLGTESHTANSNTAIRLTFDYTLGTPGRYEIRIRRTDAKDTSSRAGHEVRWGGLRAFVDGPTSFDDVTLLLVKMRATDNLSQRTVRSVNVIQTRKIPVWDSELEEWTEPTASRSIAWAFADIIRAQYGGKQGNSRIPISELVALDALLSGRGDYIDGVFDTKTTIWDALTRVARCGRAVPILQGGIIRAVRDTEQTIPVGMFGPRNIIKGSFEITYIMPSEDTADAVTVEFFNERTWKPGEVTASVSDSSEENPVTIGLFGIVNKDHAEREANYMAADNRYRRKIVSFRTEQEGAIPSYGDLISVSHDLPNWGQGGEVIDWDSEAGLLTLSEPLTFSESVNHYIGLRKRDGSVAGPFQCEAAAGDDQVHLLEALTLTPYTGSQEERTYFSFGPGDAWSQLCRVIAVRPRKGGEQVEITAVAEDTRVHVN